MEWQTQEEPPWIDEHESNARLGEGGPGRVCVVLPSERGRGGRPTGEVARGPGFAHGFRLEAAAA